MAVVGPVPLHLGEPGILRRVRQRFRFEVSPKEPRCPRTTPLRKHEVRFRMLLTRASLESSFQLDNYFRAVPHQGESDLNVSRREAVEMLREGDRAGQAVDRRAPKEHVVFIGWALFNALMIPGFDVFDRAVWGWVTIGMAVAGVVATVAYYATRSIQVEVKQRSPWWTWPLMGLWIAVAGLLAAVLDGRVAFAYTVAGLVGAAPLLAWGLHLRRGA